MEDDLNSLRVLVTTNLNHFTGCEYSYAPRFVKVLTVLKDHLEEIEHDAEMLREVAPQYDLDERTQGNGYRSYVSLIDTFVSKTISICRTLELNRDGYCFQANKLCLELESAACIFGGFRSGLACLQKMLKANQPGELFSSEDSISAQELLDEYVTLDQTGFYGRHMGFYYSESMRRILLGVGVIMASFSNLYQKSGGAVAHAARAVINGATYCLDPEARARQIVRVAQNASVEFIKAFWSLSESHLMKQVPNWLCPPMGVYDEIDVPAVALELPTTLDGRVEIPRPSSHLPPAPVRCRLLSFVRRKGQVNLNKRFTFGIPRQPSRGLLFHVHGGGFIAQTPECHEIYLRDWARDLNVPVLSVDYSLAPQAPYPRALEEVLQAYAWALLNKKRLGWTGERIVVAGDSAGGNLVMSLTLKAIELGIRLPDAVVCVYTPLILDLVPSPSRMLCVIDPLLPLGFMLSCLDSYAGLCHQSVDDPFIEEPLSQRESATQSDGANSLASRKTSMIVAIDSGINLIKCLGGLCVEGEFASFQDRSRSGQQPSDNSAESIGESNRLPDTANPSVPLVGAYVDKFTSTYLKSEVDPTENCTESDEHLIYEVPFDITFDIRRQCCKATRKYTDKLTQMVTSNEFYKRYLALTTTDNATSPKVPWFQESRARISQRFRRIKLAASDPFVSPILASDGMLAQMPPLYLISPKYDPTLDDSVMLARRLRNLNREVSLDIVDKLPHGFLNFIPFCKEAHEGSKLCVDKIKEGFGFFT